MNFESKIHTDDNVSRLAHLLNQKSLNATLYEKKKIRLQDEHGGAIKLAEIFVQLPTNRS